MPYGLYKATAYYNKLEALRDWETAANKARLLGLADKVEEFKPDPSFGWRRIDACTAKLNSLTRQPEQRNDAETGQDCPLCGDSGIDPDSPDGLERDCPNCVGHS